jgi:hypothetical protein
VEGEGDGIVSKAPEPFHSFFDGLNAHYGGAFLRTPAVSAFGGTAKGGDDHYVKRPFSKHCFSDLLLSINSFLEVADNRHKSD